MINKTLFILIVFVICSYGFGMKKTLPEVTKVIEATKLDTQLISEIDKGLHPDIVLECKEGTTLPIKFLQRTELFSIGLAPNLKINFEKTCYLRIFEKKVYVSFDLDHWEKAGHFFKGKQKIDLKMNPPASSLLVEMNLDKGSKTEK